MSKSKMHTKDKILNKALEMFNERGIEYVGLRELAAVLGIRVGNITYYFPTKDDLVYALSQELGKKNSGVIVTSDNLTMKGFLEMQFAVFQHHQQFRCLMLSFVHLMQQNKLIAEAYKETQKTRKNTIRANMTVLAKSGYLDIKGESELEFMVTTLALISRFWISEAAISFRKLEGDDLIIYYIKLVTTFFLPYSTIKGKKEISDYLKIY
ncbi:MAG: TetR/AcrR family transcriptional regulator [Chitinophagaceae bacterium]|nr:MAG: TetR/AcrR family transcriptional regulator [Chitinophagaceae bacterium]